MKRIHVFAQTSRILKRCEPLVALTYTPKSIILYLLIIKYYTYALGAGTEDVSIRALNLFRSPYRGRRKGGVTDNGTNCSDVAT